VPFHAHSSSTSLVPRSFPALWWLSVPQHRHSFSKKKLLASTAFFASLGVFIVGINTNALWLFAHFFRRLPKGIYLKNNILQWQSSKKIERKMKLIRQSLVLNLMSWLFLVSYFERIEIFFFK
jgi:hypothetical protein